MGVSDDTTHEHVATPGIVMVARSTEAVALVFGPDAMLGRTIKTSHGETYEINDERMSREHASVRFEKGHWIVADQGSRNGTFVGGQRVTGEIKRRGDTTLRLGHSVFVLLTDAIGHPTPIEHGGGVVGPELGRAYARIRNIATHDVLLVHAEPGAGKEVAARLFHESGPRSAGPFVNVNCATMPEGVAERLLFGANKGIVESIGHFQMARGGTLFLDEASALGPTVQEKLLRAIENKQIEPVGATTGTPIDVGIVFGAHAELKLAVGEGRFDADLWKRIAQVAVSIPPLRDRKVDIARLAQREVAAVDPKVNPHAKLIEACIVRPWPGNVRELQAAVRKATLGAIAEKRDIVRVEDLDPGAGLTTGALAAETAVERPGRRDTPPADIDKSAIEAALVRANGVVHLAARILGIHRSVLYQLMDKHGIVFTDE